MVDRQFMDGGVAGQIGFMNAAIGSQEIALTSPTAFIGVDMHFTNAIAILIARPFMRAMTDRVANTM